MRLRSTPAAAAVLLVSCAALSSCGFSYSTDREYTVNSSTDNREGEVDVLNAVVVSAAEGSGTFVASFANNDIDEEETLTGVAGDEGTSITAPEFEPVTIPADGLVNLADPPADIVLTGDFTAGDFVPLVLDFGNGERIAIKVPVVSDDSGYWEGLDAS
jgi:hypothetical protein